MAGEEAAKRYAQAAFELAGQSGGIERWRADLEDVARVLTDSEAAGIFADSRIPLERRVAMVDRTLDVQPLVANLAKLLVTKGRSRSARAVATAFGRMADEAAGIADAEVTAAIDLTPQQLASIEQRLSASLGKRVKVTAKVDPSLIGGVVVRVGDKLVDGSVRTRLKDLRRELSGAG
jgi:F-type H+-transporting ATPase subunit delta